MFSTTGPILPLTAPSEVLLGSVAFVCRGIEGLLTGLQFTKRMQRISLLKRVWDPYHLSSLMTAIVVIFSVHEDFWGSKSPSFS